MRVSTRFIMSMLLFPLMVNMMRPLSCDGTWLATGWQCYQGAHLATLLLTIAFLLLSLPLGVFSTYLHEILRCGCEPHVVWLGVVLQPAQLWWT